MSVHAERNLDPRATAAYRRSWLSLLLFLPCFVGAFLVGEGLVSMLAGDVATDEFPPFWVVVAAGAPAMAVFCVPVYVAWVLGRRAARLGHGSAMVPVLVAAVVAGLFVAQNVLSYALGTLLD